MEPLDETQSRRILEVPAQATLEEINRAYRRQKHIHGSDAGLHAAPAMEEFSPEARSGILEQIEAAYRLLCQQVSAAPETAPAPVLPAEIPGDGRNQPAPWTALRQARNAAGLSLEQVAAETHVRLEYVGALEEEHFDLLRLPMVNVRGYLTAYVHAVGLSVEAVVPAYLKKFQDWQSLHA